MRNIYKINLKKTSNFGDAIITKENLDTTNVFLLTVSSLGDK